MFLPEQEIGAQSVQSKKGNNRNPAQPELNDRVQQENSSAQQHEIKYEPRALCRQRRKR